MKAIFSFIFIGITFLSSFDELPAQVMENINYLKKDGRSLLNYRSVRSDYPTYYLALEKKFRPEEYYDYINPNKYTFQEEPNLSYNKIIFNTGSFATMREEFLDNDQVKVDAQGVYTYKKLRNTSSEGHYGYWNLPNGFKQFVLVWVFPDNFEVIDYSSNRDGEWLLRNNTLSYYGFNVNDLLFTIRYRPRGSQVFASQSQGKLPQSIETSITPEGVKITLGAQVLFASGSATISASGQSLLKQVAASLKDLDQKIIIGGHTDNVPVRNSLFKNNWDLSAARALSVVNFFQAQGISPKRLEIRAYADQQPVASNQTETGRAKNRRIELLLRTGK